MWHLKLQTAENCIKLNCYQKLIFKNIKNHIKISDMKKII